MLTPRQLTCLGLAFCGSFVLLDCTPHPAGPVVEIPQTASELAYRGEQIYHTICVSCHNADPRQAGAIGPALVNSSASLLEARLIRGSYPAGYHPQRETHQMPLYPQLAAEIPALAAYLQAFNPELATPAPPATPKKSPH